MSEKAELLVLVVDYDHVLQEVCDQIKTDAGVNRILCESTIEGSIKAIKGDAVDSIVVNKEIDQGCELAKLYPEIVTYYADSRHNTNRIETFWCSAAHYIEKQRGFKELDLVLDAAIYRGRVASVR
jgi:hypothetical protein